MNKLKNVIALMCITALMTASLSLNAWYGGWYGGTYGANSGAYGGWGSGMLYNYGWPGYPNGYRTGCPANTSTNVVRRAPAVENGETA